MKNIYLFLLATLVGIEIALGIFVAPVIFYPQKFIGSEVLTHFQSGILMTQIFLKYNYALIIISLFAFVFSVFVLRSKDCFYVRVSTFALNFINLSLACIFVFYFTPYILTAQAIGESATIQSAEFMNIHKASELTMKIMMMAQILLFFVGSLYKKQYKNG
ncbi:DUF4149 domain-containing protein [Campylobacter sp. faydin G-140]|uniref:DUF4149 domain-containing protein n=1 Tax=Campylobacter anatolicus TaxID=2829105 RepID=UPI001B936DF7|nr:DUF4149 domain-containing protein [Campylobacter anatolicus]MBR8466060.1 DUF4149 domain-containing protein [Campylobacter anatolicus]